MAPEATPDGANPAVTYSAEDLFAIVDAGMPVGEARALLSDGFSVDVVLSLAQRQARQRVDAATETQAATAKAMQKAMRPENETHPGISAFSYPEGDRARPRVTLPFEFFLNGYPCHKFPETEHWRELELMAQVKPGVFTVLRRDGSLMKVDVEGTKDANGTVTRIEVKFPITREERWLVPPKIVLLHQLVHQDADNLQALFLESMTEYMRLTMARAAA